MEVVGRAKEVQTTDMGIDGCHDKLHLAWRRILELGFLNLLLMPESPIVDIE